MLKKKIWANFKRIIELFTKKIVKKLLKIWSWDPGSEKKPIPDPGVKKRPITDPGSGSATLPVRRTFMASIFRGFATSWSQIRQNYPPFRMAKIGERAGWSAVWYSSLTGWEKSAQFKLKMVSDVLLLSYLDKIGLSLTGGSRASFGVFI